MVVRSDVIVGNIKWGTARGLPSPVSLEVEFDVPGKTSTHVCVVLGMQSSTFQVIFPCTLVCWETDASGSVPEHFNVLRKHNSALQAAFLSTFVSWGRTQLA